MAVPTLSMNMRSVLFAARDAGEAPLREADLEMFQILARQATIAMDNANLYGELRAYVRRVEESQRALVQSEKLAAAGRLTASIAHEINNPCNRFAIACTWLSMKICRLKPQKIYRYDRPGSGTLDDDG
jgi:C4-dicarboxylate-specific signal transduction histidine kinase